MTWFKKKNQPPLVTAATQPVEAALKISTNFKVPVGLVRFWVVSEKANRLQSKGQYTFAVYPKATKVELKKMIEKLYKVHVTKVTSATLPGKVVYTRNRPGYRSDRKFMRVHLRPGETIDLAKS